MTKTVQSILVISLLTLGSCKSVDKKDNASTPTEKSAKAPNFDAIVAQTSGEVISELSFTEKENAEKGGKHITKYFADSSKVVFTVYKTADKGAYDVEVYTINIADAKGLKADLTPMNDNSDSQTKYTPDNFGGVSLVFVANGTATVTDVISNRTVDTFGGEQRDKTEKTNSISIPVKDFKSAEAWVAKLKGIFK